MNAVGAEAQVRLGLILVGVRAQTPPLREERPRATTFKVTVLIGSLSRSIGWKFDSLRQAT